jgi:hypothetical protein
MDKAQFESSPNMPKFLFVCAWGQLVDASIFAHQQMEHQEQPDRQQKD